MVRIIRVAFLLPEPRVHGTDTTCRVFLCKERSLVLRDLVEIVSTVPNGLPYSGEAGTRLHLASRDRCATLVAVLAPRIDALTLGVSGGSRTVRRYEVTAVLVTTLLFPRSRITKVFPQSGE